MWQNADKPNPQNIRDLRLMYDTASKVDGIIEYKRLGPKVMSSREYHEGDITGMQLRVVPSNYRDLVTVVVQRTKVTNLRDGCPPEVVAANYGMSARAVRRLARRVGA